MKTLVEMSLAIGLLAGGSAFAATAPLGLNTDMCDQWNLKSGDLSACHAQWNAARTPEERSFVVRKYNPDVGNINAAQDARDSLGSGAQRNTGASGTTNANPPEAHEILPGPSQRGSVLNPQAQP